MSSILTNNGAMVALQTLRGINKNLNETQNAIATGKEVATAKDNAAVWAIAKVMESDVGGFKAISDTLGLGESTVTVARQAAETSTDLLKQMKAKIVSAQEDNVDREKLQADIRALRDQIESVTNAAQFNGLNLLNNQDAGRPGTGTVEILSSLDRSSDGVTASDIVVQKEDMKTNKAGAFTAAHSSTNTFSGANTGTFAVSATGSLGTIPTSFAAGDFFEISINHDGGTATTFSFGVQEGDTTQDVMRRVTDTLTFVAQNRGLDVNFAEDPNTPGAIIATNTGTTDIIDFSATMAVYQTFTGTADAIDVGGRMALLSDFDVTTEAGAKAALSAIEGLIQMSIDAAASFGSTQARIETQQSFVSNLMDSLKSGIGTLVDADMEEESARLQALQVQQQLGVQALSIANQAPQRLLSLFGQ